VIGYYVHHHGHGHLHRAIVLADACRLPVFGISSLPRPAEWAGDWVQLPRDDDDPAPRDASARGQLHWAPLDDEGLRRRMATLSAWIVEHRPAVLVSDVSVEVAMLARLHGVPVVSVVLPGERGDPPHRAGLGLSSELVSFWPPSARGMVRGLAPADAARLRCLGALSRFSPDELTGERPQDGVRRVVVLNGSGGGGPTADQLERARATSPGWAWQVLGGPTGAWVADPAAALRDADVVVTHAGQNALAEVAAARRPAVVVPQDRPHDEQRTTAGVLDRGGWPVVVRDQWPDVAWGARLDLTARLDGELWASWCDGRAVHRFVGVVHAVAGAGVQT
jgi:Glycosyltransferase family 28 C-terminal domain